MYVYGQQKVEKIGLTNRQSELHKKNFLREEKVFTIYFTGRKFKHELDISP